MTLSGWGRFPRHAGALNAPRTEAEIAAGIARGGVIARGNGRAYGDSAVAADGPTLAMRHFNHMLAFDPGTGQLEAEAGVLLADIIATFLPRGWFPAVTPGTKFVTLGGMIAADVHGKNHHRDGSFGAFVDWIDLMGADGRVRRCSPTAESELFAWTLGGMGLTGVILRAAIRLQPVETAWIRQTLRPLPDLDAALAGFEAAGDVPYSVAWIDCLSRGAALGRSLLMLGEHATRANLDPGQARDPLAARARRARRMPLDAPQWLLNGATARAFNALYYRSGLRKAGTALIDWDSYFYPLDAVRDWNRVYGRKGFMQFQCVLPESDARAGLRALLEATSGAGLGAFLAVLKKFGRQDSAFSFPMLGYTLALDFPVTPRTLALMKELDRITLDHGGRFYLAKDSRLSADTFSASDTRVAAFRKMRDTAGLRAHFQSKQSQRLAI